MGRSSIKCGLFMGLLALTVLSRGLWAQDVVEEFRQAFQKAVEADDFATQAKLVDDNKDAAWNAYFRYEKLWVGALNSKDEALKEKWMLSMEYLSSTYRAKHNDKFLSRRRVELQKTLSSEEMVKLYIEAANAAVAGYEAYNSGAADGNDEAMAAALKEYTRAVRLCQKLNDHYLAATYANFVGENWLKSGEPFKSAYWYRVAQDSARRAQLLERFSMVAAALQKTKEKRQIEFPELIDIKLGVDEAKVAYEKALADRNKIDVEAGAGKKGKSKAARSLGTLVAPTTTAEYTFEQYEGFKAKSFKLFTKIKVPYYNFRAAGPKNPQEAPFYQFISLEKEKEPIDANNFFPGAKLSYDGKVLLQMKGAKSPKKLKIKAKFDKVKQRVTYSDGTKRQITNMVADFFPEMQQLFGQKFNFSDAAKVKTLAWYGNTGIVGKVRGQEIAILDCNGNGNFKDTGVDAVMIGKGKKARIEPLGRYILLPDQGGLYPFEFKITERHVKYIRIRPYKGSLAPVIVDFKMAAGLKPDFLVVKGSGEDSEAYFDVAKAMNGQPIWIPPGRYFVHLGYITVGKGKKAHHILIGRGRSGVLHARSGQLNEWAFGGAGEKGFWLNGKFTPGEKPGEVFVPGQEVEIYGNHGESYFNLGWDLRIAPTAIVKKNDGNGPTLGKKEMRVRSKGNRVELWYPTDVTIKNTGSNSTKKVGKLVLDHKILGKIESEWILVQ